MFSRLVRIQLAAFSALTIFAVSVVVVDYLGFGVGKYTVTADFADASGLYSGAEVTYLGVQVGRVASMDLGVDGVRVSLSLDSRVPASLRAEIHSTSAIGEQYVDLSPVGDTSRTAVDGTSIPQSRTRAMTPTEALLSSVDSLAQAVPTDRLRTVLTEVTTAFQGSHDDLRQLLDQASLLVHDATADAGPTVNLINQLGPFLATQHALDGQIRSYTRDLASFTDQLRLSGDDLRRLVDTVPGFDDQVLGLQDQLRPTLPMLLGNMIATGQVVRTYLPGVEQLLSTYPATVAVIQGMLLRHGGIAATLRLNINDPPPCTTGFLSNPQRRDPSDTKDIPAPRDLYCKVTPADPRVVRGARNTPCLNAPGRRGASPEQCLEQEPPWQKLLVK
ncbi:MCE family protein [Kutzneria buriramensis]|uniref:Phospholipid/cholesterol/gamma-HCH transport system substrate-binding protein n=1 Tax=Kutzneria buriramensis TaxID=1045776 RepID=A0A3E0HA51_9PSEU|nr:MlaD family protein [Kutzneria buriramensis]REH40929.1 phospholipid/cholesterol/gamma-HCH transport system substrate-binding protein [Kutzneria buriramensis]